MQRISGLLLSGILISASALAQSTLLDQFSASKSSLQNHLIECELDDAWIESGSAIYAWKDYHDFPALSRQVIEAAYGARNQVEVAKEIERRLKVFEIGSNPMGFFDTGLAALSYGNEVEARRCFSEALGSEEFVSNPFCHAYFGIACLRSNDLEGAQQAFDAAIQCASTSGPMECQIEFLYTMELYDTGHLSSAFEENGPLQACLESNYPLERAFALYEFTLHAWSLEDEQAIQDYLSQLQATLPMIEAREDSEFEQRRLSQATELAERVQAALSGDQVARMILDEESSDFFFKTNQWKRARDRLKPWAIQFPLTAYSEWDAEFRDAATWVHLNYLIAECNSDNFSIAEDGFNDFIQTVSETDESRKVIEAYCWLGYSLLRQNRLQEAATALETGLQKDALGSLSMSHGLPIDSLQPRILGGKMRYQTRESFVKQHREILLRLKEESE